MSSVDYGSKGSLPGYDVKTAVDYLLQYHSSWPLLKVGDTNVASGTVDHNLGYYPFHIVTTATGQVSQLVASSDIGVSTTQLFNATGLRYFIFRLPLTEAFTAPIIPGNTTLTSFNDDYGYKVARPGKDVSSTDLRDFSLHSSTRSPMLHTVSPGAMVNTGGGLGFEYTVPHSLGYTPIAFAFIQPGVNALGMTPGRYFIVRPAIGVAGFSYVADSSSVYVTADNIDFTDTPNVSVVILKDPFDKQDVNISFP